jgi:hypothetical protein
MNLPVSPLGFRSGREVLFGQALAHLQLAQRLPLRVICAGVAHYVDPDLDLNRWGFEREIDLGTCAGLAEAMALATLQATCDEIAASRDDALRLAPQFVTVIDAECRLVLAGEVRGGLICWCAPVASDAEARVVVLEASRLRAEAAVEADRDDLSAASAFRLRARLLEGRLVDPFWREAARSALDQAQAA